MRTINRWCHECRMVSECVSVNRAAELRAHASWRTAVRSCGVALGVFVMSLCLSICAGARTWHIRADGFGDAPTIQAGIDSASTETDTVLIAAGTYHETLTTNGKYVILQGSGPDVTTIDGGYQGRVLDMSGGGAVVAVTLQHGATPDEGGGIRISGSRPTVVRFNTIADNVATGFEATGGGVFIAQEATGVVIDLNTIRNNMSYFIGGVYDGSNSLMTNNQIIGNSGGVAASRSTLRNNLILNNTSDYPGAGIAVMGGPAEISNNTIVGNGVVNNPPDIGVAIAAAGSATITRNIIARNYSSSGRAVAVACSNDPFFTITLSCNDIWANDNNAVIGNCDTTDARTFSADPLFCDESRGDFHIDSVRSPALFPPGGCVGFIGAFEPRCILTATTKTTWSNIKRLYR